jgi:hypothetical protein
MDDQAGRPGQHNMPSCADPTLQHARLINSTTSSTNYSIMMGGNTDTLQGLPMSTAGACSLGNNTEKLVLTLSVGATWGPSKPDPAGTGYNELTATQAATAETHSHARQLSAQQPCTRAKQLHASLQTLERARGARGALAVGPTRQMSAQAMNTNAAQEL